MKGVNRTKLIFLQSSLNHKQGGHGFNASFSILLSHHHYYRRWLIAVLSFFTVASLLALMLKASNSRGVDTHASSVSLSAGEEEKLLPVAIIDALVEYAASFNSSEKMEKEDMRVVAGILRLRAPCNLLVFGIGHEMPLWRALNHGGRTMFMDESEHLVGRAEGMNPGLEAYDVAFTTTIQETLELLAATRRQRRGDCPQEKLWRGCGGPRSRSLAAVSQVAEVRVVREGGGDGGRCGQKKLRRGRDGEEAEVEEEESRQERVR